MATLSNIQTLIYLCHKKNELNRRRRRFYNLMSGYVICTDKEYASFMYGMTKSDMKAMTKEMREMRVALGASFAWSCHGAINWVNFSDGRCVYAKDFKKWHDAEVFEMEVLGS